MDEPPIGEWAEDGALREVARLARDLPTADADEAQRRLERLSVDQRELVERALRRMAEEVDDA